MAVSTMMIGERWQGQPSLIADLEGGREPRRRVKARIRAYRLGFTPVREGR